MIQNAIRRAGNTRYALIALLLGLPIPIVLLIWLFLGR
jgi:Na+-driven multidrug efflux pump